MCLRRCDLASQKLMSMMRCLHVRTGVDLVACTTMPAASDQIATLGSLSTALLAHIPVWHLKTSGTVHGTNICEEHGTSWRLPCAPESCKKQSTGRSVRRASRRWNCRVMIDDQNDLVTTVRFLLNVPAIASALLLRQPCVTALCRALLDDKRCGPGGP